MKRRDLIDAEKWFALHDYNTYVHEYRALYVDMCEFEFEISEEEIKYRARLYNDYIRNTRMQIKLSNPTEKKI